MYENEKEKVLESALQLRKNQLISLTGGNVSMRMPGNSFLITPSGMEYTQMIAKDIVLVDEKGNVVEGNRKPSSDTPALLYIFQHMPHVNVIIHTHQPYATAVGLVEDKIPACLVTLIDAVHDAVQVAPYTPSSDINMGVLTVKYAGKALAVILKHHGVIAYGKDLEEALYSAVYLEESAKTYLFARLLGKVPMLSKKDINAELIGWKNYGQ